MKFLLDANLSSNIIPVLQGVGYDVRELIGDERYFVDEDVLATALREDRILLTSDKDFGYLVIYQQLPHCGIVLLRLPRTPIRELPRLVLDVVRTYQHRLTGAMMVVTEDRVRFHTTQHKP